MLPHATRLAGSPHARFFTRGLALSLLQRKPEEWRRQHATPSSGGSANTATSSSNKDKNTRVDATTPSTIVVVPTNNKDPEADEARTSSPERERRRKKRKRSAAPADEIDALFDDAIGRKVVRSALEPAPASTPMKSGTKKADLALKQGRSQDHQGVDHDRQAELGAVVDAIKVAPRHEGKRSKRRLGPAG